MIEIQSNLKYQGDSKNLWKILPDPQARLWIQLGDKLYFWKVENDWSNKKTRFSLWTFCMVNFVEAEVEGHSTEFLDLSKDKYRDFGIQLVSWGVDMIGVAGKDKPEDLAANMKST